MSDKIKINKELSETHLNSGTAKLEKQEMTNLDKDFYPSKAKTLGYRQIQWGKIGRYPDCKDRSYA